MVIEKSGSLTLPVKGNFCTLVISSEGKFCIPRVFF